MTMVTAGAQYQALQALRGELRAAIGFVPTEAQGPILDCDKRFILVTGGERSGKSMAGKEYLLERLWEPLHPGIFWLVGIDYAQTEQEFLYLAEDLQKLGVVEKGGISKRVDPGKITLKNRTFIETKSAKDPSRLGKVSPDGILVCEAGLVDYVTYERMVGRVGASRGWLMMTGTLEDSRGWYAAKKVAWAHGTKDEQSFSLPTPSNTYAFPGGWNDPEILLQKAKHSDLYWRERMLGEVVAPTGLVFPEFRADVHVRDVKWAGPETIVYIWEDPGYGSKSAHAIEIAQIVGGQVQVFDEVYEQGIITKDLIRLCQKRPWWKSPKVLVSDPHYKDAHHSMNSVAEIWMKEAGLIARGDRGHIPARNERIRSFLDIDRKTNAPGIVFSPHCAGILSEFGYGTDPFDKQAIHAYSWKLDRDGNVVGEVPEDRWNHGISAIGYGLVEKFGYAGRGEKKVLSVRYW